MGGSRGPAGVARLRGCAVVRESLLYYSELIEGVARLHGCAVVRENLLYYCDLIVMQNMYCWYPCLRRCSPHVNCLVCCTVIYVYIAGINAASQEVFSRTRGVEINLAIKYYCVLHVTYVIVLVHILS